MDRENGLGKLNFYPLENKNKFVNGGKIILIHQLKDLNGLSKKNG